MSGPTPRRVKTYTAQTGYVYQYYFVGKRAAGEAFVTEYIFDVSRDRKTVSAVSVFLQGDAVESWAATHGRRLSDTEQYAAAKLRLLKGFDEDAQITSAGRSLVLDADILEEVLEPLDLL